MSKKISLTEFSAQFDAADNTIQTLVRILAIYIKPITPAQISRCFNETTEIHGNQQLKADETKVLLEHLTKVGILQSVNGYAYLSWEHALGHFMPLAQTDQELVGLANHIAKETARNIFYMSHALHELQGRTWAAFLSNHRASFTYNLLALEQLRDDRAKAFLNVLLPNDHVPEWVQTKPLAFSWEILIRQMRRDVLACNGLSPYITFVEQKPVTVYRFVADNTIEDKIIQLHEQKRDLADSLLSGTATSAKLTAEELIELLKS